MEVFNVIQVKDNVVSNVNSFEDPVLAARFLMSHFNEQSNVNDYLENRFHQLSETENICLVPSYIEHDFDEQMR